MEVNENENHKFMVKRIGSSFDGETGTLVTITRLCHVIKFANGAIKTFPASCLEMVAPYPERLATRMLKKCSQQDK